MHFEKDQWTQTWMETDVPISCEVILVQRNFVSFTTKRGNLSNAWMSCLTFDKMSIQGRGYEVHEFIEWFNILYGACGRDNPLDESLHIACDMELDDYSLFWDMLSLHRQIWHEFVKYKMTGITHD